jgi:MFS family permease
VRLWPEGGLWRQSDFLKLWSAQTVSQFGTQISQLALPLAAIDVIHASAFEVAALTAVEFLPFLLVSLPAGVWVDRLPRRPILIAGDLARAGLLASIPIAYFFDALTIWQLYGVGFFVGIATVFFDIAYQSYLPSLVERREIVDGNAKLEVSRSAAQTGGPGLAGVLIGLLKAPPAILIDAVSFLASAIFIFSIRKTETSLKERAPRRKMRIELKEGLSYVLRHPYLKYIAACTALFNFFGNVVFAVLLVFARRELHLGALAIGIAFTIGNLGAMLAAFSANRISRRLGIGPTIIVASVIGGPMFLIIPFAPHGQAALAVVIPALIVGSFTNVVYNVAQISLRQAITPEHIQGRMNSVMRFIVWGTIPLGAFTSGALASQIGLKETMIIGGVGCCLAFLPVLFSPVSSVREMPEPLEERPLDVILADAEAAAVPPPHL